MSGRSYTLLELAEYAGARLSGAPDSEIRGIGSIAGARPGDLTFLGDAKHRRLLAATRASAVVLKEEDSGACRLPALICDDPYLAFAAISRLFRRADAPGRGIHPSAVVAGDAVIGEDATIGACSVIGAGCRIGKGTAIGPNCTVMEDCRLGDNCRLAAQVTLQGGARLGDGVVIHPGAVVGADGFGYARRDGGWVKIEQVGGVRIGDDVEIGANTTIDRGALDDTVIGNGVKIDNQVQIAHNVRIGDGTAIAGCVGIAGSAVIGRRCMIGGLAGIQGHVEICDDVVISAMTSVMKSISKPGRYTSCLPQQGHREWLRNALHYRRLGGLAERVNALAGPENKRAKGADGR